MVNKYLKLVFNTSKKKISLKKKIKKINYYEKKYNFYKRLDNGYIKWDYIRLIISRTIGKIDSTFKKDFKNQLTNNFFNNLFYFKNFKIFFSYKKKDIIFFGHNRGTLKNNIIIDEYLDKIVKYFKKKKIIVLSGGHFYYGCRYNYNDNRIFLNYLHLYLKIKSYFILYLNKKELNIVKKKSDKFELIYQSESENWWYCYFKKLNPKYIFFVSINTYLPVVRAANKLNIKTIEIQHGTPNTKKIEYSYNVNPNERLSSPTFFLGWGIFWKRYVNKFYYRKSFINFGKSINNKTILCKNNSSDILFIDQFIFREELSNKAIEISKNFGSKIIYRFHPNVNFKKEVALNLKKNKIIIHNPTSNNLSKSLKNVKFVVGVASTALLELACKNFKVLVLPSEEFDYKEFISKKKIFGLNLLNNNTVKSSKVFAKPNYELLKNLSFK